MNRTLKVLAVFLFLSVLSCFFFIKPKADTDYISVQSWYTWNDILNGIDNYIGYEFAFNGSLREPMGIQTTTEINGEYVTRGNWVYQITGLAIGQNYLSYKFTYVDSLTGSIDTFELPVFDFTNGWEDNNFKVIWITGYDYTFVDNYLLDTFLDLFGVYGIREQLPNYSISDLLFTYVDIIPRVTQSMTNFEILGFSLFAILGTFILILLIVKILKGGIL